MIITNCRYCGAKIEDNTSNHNKKFCNTNCRDKFRRHGSISSLSINEEGEMEMKLEKTDLAELLEEISRRGFISTRREMLVDRTYKFPRKLKPFKLGIVSDTHLGSSCQQITLLHEAYKIMKDKGVRKVLHIGDLTDGNGKQFKGQVYEMFLHGADSIADYAIKNYPKIKGITTYIIGGSHDYSFFKEDGTDILQRIGEKRSDIKYLGMFGAYINIGKICIYVMHGSGGVAYARSYRMQKIIEQFPPEKKPNMLFLGHYHVECHLPNYRNVAGFQVPCFQTQTNYLRAKGLSPEIGFLIVEIFPDTKGLAHYTPDWHPFYVPIHGDF